MLTWHLPRFCRCRKYEVHFFVFAVLAFDIRKYLELYYSRCTCVMLEYRPAQCTTNYCGEEMEV